MKRVNNLFEKIVDIKNLYLAYYKAKKGKGSREEVINFSANLENNLIVMRENLINGTIEVGNYHYFKIYDPKPRQICAAAFPERVLHHAIMNVCEPVFDKYLIYDTYATRKGKGTYAAIERAMNFLKKTIFYAKLDIRKYFDSIDHLILKRLLMRKFKDKKLLDLFFKIIDSYSVSENKGIPIGNLTSQFFANFFLSTADHFAKENLKVKYYIRYMDDIVMFDIDKIRLKNNANKFVNYVKENLSLDFKTFLIGKNNKGLVFLGYKLYPNALLLSNRAKKRFKRKLKKYSQLYEKGKWSEKEYQNHLLPLFAYVQKAKSYNFRKKVLNDLG